MVIGVISCTLIMCLHEDTSLEDIEWAEVFNPLVWLENGIFTSWEGFLSIPVPALLVACTQIAFLLPVFSKRLQITTQGRSLKWTVCAAGLVGGFLFTGLILSLLELLMIWEPAFAWSYDQNLDIPIMFVIFWISIGVCWLLWLPILFIFARRKGPRRLHEKIIVLLLAGTVIETLVILPIDMMVRRRTNCYCGTGTFFAFCMSIWALLWLAGPGIVLAITAKRRRLIAETHCINCGYDKGPSPGPVCPECGFDWSNAKKTGGKPSNLTQKGG